MPQPLYKNKRYMPGIDGLRALAVLAVIAYHLNFGWASGGLLGVGIFFVLSGYLITDLIISEFKQTGKIDFKQFWLRRARRLLPALLSMLIVVILWVLLFEHAFIVGLWGNLLSVFFYVSNWWLIYHKVSYFEQFGPPSPLNHLWSLAVEEQFYVVWPLILLFGLRFIKKSQTLLKYVIGAALLSAILMAILYTPNADPSRVYYGTDTRAFSLLIGAALAFIWPSKQLAISLSRAPRFILEVIGLVGLGGVLLLVYFTSQFDAFLYYGGMVLLSIFTLLLVAALAHPSTFIGKLMGWRPLRWIGVRSYGIYLWHFPIIIFTRPPQQNVESSVSLSILQFIAIITIASLSWHFIEEPIRHGALDVWKRQLIRKVSRFAKASMQQKLVIAGASLTLVILFFSMLIPAIQHIGEEQVKKSQTAIFSKTKRAEAASASEKSDDQKETKHAPAKKNKKEKKISVIGDSIMFNVASYIKKTFPKAVVDAKIGRQLTAAGRVIDLMKQENVLADTVVIALGTNGAFSKEQLLELLHKAGDEKHFILINTRVDRPWEAVVNRTLEEVAREHPRTVLIDWKAESADHYTYFDQDGIHLSEEGSKVYAKLIAQAIK
ncbi:acyltransferase 3 [Fictibacillus macauensis ZFHKF-1]|uniref:Acyltransferase 3 n=1 Tax=Fictibacillus macauensis ZFHKF-1 TaxID=1196324 RepID=I8AMP8_9BACL|nr:acyltransferase family protein [Fictibacillus macauensis]EIT86949.1 acyltransferase 3 [Fictibacillus macauensis ZFHKF-1]